MDFSGELLLVLKFKFTFASSIITRVSNLFIINFGV